MAETQSGSIKAKEDVNATALGVDVMCLTCIHGVEKTPVEFTDPSEFYKQPVAQVLPPISEKASPNITGESKKPRKPRQKKTKNGSNTIEQALEMQPTNINKESSSENKKKEVHFTQEPSTSKINPPDSCLLLPKHIKSLAPSAEHGVPEAVSNQDPETHVLSVSAEEVLTNAKPKKSNKPRSKKKKKKSSTTEQTIEMQPANINKASSAANKMQIHFIPEPCTSKMNSHKNIKTLALSFEQGVPNTISNQDNITKAMPKIAEDVSDNIPEVTKKSKKPKCKKNKNCSKTTEREPKMQIENNNKVSSSIVVQTQVHFNEPSKGMIDAPKKIITSTPSAKRVIRNKYSYKFIMPHPVLPVITEETPEDIIEKPKKQRKPRQKKKKKKNHPDAVEQPLQIQLADTNEASSSAEKFQMCRIQEPSNIKPPKLVETRDETNEMNQKSKTGQQTKKVLAAVESKQHGQDNDVVNNNTTETKTEKMIYPAKNVAMENEKSQTARDSMQESDEKTERGAQIPVQNYYLPAEGVANDDEKPQISQDALKDQKVEGNNEAQVKSHLSFFREFYDHSGRLNVRNFNTENLYIDGLYSPGKLICQDHAIKEKIEEAIHAIMNEITIDFKDFRVPIPTLEVLFNRMHNIIFMRLYRIGLTELASIELCNIVAVYRTQFNKADDIKFLYTILGYRSEELFKPII